MSHWDGTACVAGRERAQSIRMLYFPSEQLSQICISSFTPCLGAVAVGPAGSRQRSSPWSPRPRVLRVQVALVAVELDDVVEAVAAPGVEPQQHLLGADAAVLHLDLAVEAVPALVEDLPTRRRRPHCEKCCCQTDQNRRQKQQNFLFCLIGLKLNFKKS